MAGTVLEIIEDNPVTRAERNLNGGDHINKKVLASIIGGALVLLAVACVTASSFKAYTPLYVLRMEQASSEMNFLPTTVNDFLYSAENGVTVNCSVSGYCSVLPMGTDATCHPSCQTCAQTCPVTCYDTCPYTCLYTCNDITCGYTCPCTCDDPTCPYTCEGPTCNAGQTCYESCGGTCEYTCSGYHTCEYRTCEHICEP